MGRIGKKAVLYLGDSTTVAGRSFRQEGCSTAGWFHYCGSFVIQVGRLFYIWAVLQLDPSILVGSWSLS